MTAALVLLAVGCGPETPTYDPAVRYSPESLAQEFSFQYKSMKAGAGRPESPEGSGPKERSGIATKSVKAATKDARVGTLDDLLADASQKADSIPGMAPAEARKKLAEAIARDPAISDVDKKAIADKLARPSP